MCGPHIEKHAQPYQPARLLRVGEAFNRERITASDVADFLSVRVKHLPDVCSGLNMPCLSLLGMFKELGWQF